MKRLIFGLLMAGIAFGGSAFTNVDKNVAKKGGKALPSGFLVQTASGVWQYSASAPGTCSGVAANACKYQIAPTNTIPTQESYDTEDVTENFASQLTPTADGTQIYSGPL